MFSSIRSLYEPLTDILKKSETQTRQVVGLAPTHKAVKELRDKGIEAQTLQSFIIEQRRLQKENLLDLKDKLIIVDEVSMVGNKDYSDLVSLMKEGNAQVVLAGDISQLNAIPSGKPQQLLLDRDIIAVAHMKDIVRQKEPVLKEAVEKTIQKDYTEAFNLLEKQSTNVVKRDRGQLELLNPELLNIELDQLKGKLEKSIVVCPESKAGELIADDLFSRTKEVQENTLIGTDSHRDRTMLHEPIREKYKMTGELSKEESPIQRLVASRIEKAEYQRIQNYTEGQVIKIGKDFYQVDKIEREKGGKGALHLIKETDKTLRLFIPDREYKKVMELYDPVYENVAVGEKVRLTRTDKLREHIANEEYKVIGISKNVLQLEKSTDKSQVTLDTTTFKDAHWDYAYTTTAFGAQGGTGQFSIIYANPELEHLVNYRSFGVMVTRAEKHVAIYTPNKEKLVSKIINSFAEKYSAIEITEAKKENIKLSDIKKHLAEPAQTSLNKEQAKPRYDAKEINRQLTNNVEIITAHLLGEKNHHLSNGSNWRYGTKGSLSVQVSGQYQGTWHSFETGEKGNLLALIQKELGLTFVEALEYAAKLTGEDHKQLMAIDKKTTPNNDKNKTKPPEYNTNKIREYGRKLVKESTPIKNTLAEHYLKETRKIQSIGEADLRFHHAVSAGKNEQGKPIYYPALLAIARDNQGNIMSVQATYLDPKTQKKAQLPVTKRTYGTLKDHQASCAIYEAKENKNSPENKKIDRQNNDKVTYLAEGVETALSVKDIVKNQDVFAVLGKSNFKNIDPNKLNSTVVLCIDNDGKDTYNKALFDAIKVIESTGREVKIHVPPAIKERGTDINDLVQLQGLEKAKGSLSRLVDAKDLHIHAAEFAEQIDKSLTEKQRKIDLNIGKVSHEILGNSLQDGIKNPTDKAAMNAEKITAIHKSHNANLDKINQEMNKNIRAVAAELSGKPTSKDTQIVRKIDQDLAKNEREIY